MRAMALALFGPGTAASTTAMAMTMERMVWIRRALAGFLQMQTAVTVQHRCAASTSRWLEQQA